MRFIVVARQSSEGDKSREEARRKEGERLRGNFSGSMDFLHAEFASGSDGSKQAQSLHLQTELLFSKASPPSILHGGKVY